MTIENHILRLFSDIMEQADADVMCFGHTHKPYLRIFAKGHN